MCCEKLIIYRVCWKIHKRLVKKKFCCFVIFFLCLQPSFVYYFYVELEVSLQVAGHYRGQLGIFSIFKVKRS